MAGRHHLRLTEKEIKHRNAGLHLTKLVLALVVGGFFAAAWYLYYACHISSPFFKTGNWAVCTLYICLYILFAKLYGGFQVGISRISELVYSHGIALFFAGAVQFVVICLLTRRFANGLPLLGALAAGLVASALWAKLANGLHNKLFPPKRTVVVYDNLEAYRTMEKLETISWKFRITETVDIARGMDAVLAAVSEADAVFVCGLASSDRNDVLKYCIENNIQAYIRPKIGDLILSSAKRVHYLNVPVLFCMRNQTSLWYAGMKRAIDIVASVCALIIASPVIVTTAIAIKCYDHGPVMYKQCRLTKDGKTFNVYKFRSMRVDAECDGVARLASENDDRITPVGNFIRKVRIDELPQIMNILKGDMSLVGPRPERPEIAAQYEEEIPEFSLRLQVKAGLTGYAQVYGKYNTSPYDKLQMDLIYIANQSIVQDIKLMLATVKILFVSESTEGVAEGYITAETEKQRLKDSSKSIETAK